MLQQQLLQEKERQHTATELSFLKSQLQPHFFFNTLNNLYSLTVQKSDQAPEVVLRLADLMSYMLYESGAPTVALDKEILHLENYMAIERLRFGQRLTLSFEKEGATEQVNIPPLLLFAFAENSFKHGMQHTIEPGSELPAATCRRIFLRMGLAALILFVVLRYSNIYGNPTPWTVQKNAVFTFLSFINYSKYPPSLLFDLVTLGCLLLLLAAAEGRKNRFMEVATVYGKTPLFYFLIHMYVIHLAMLIMVLCQGFHPADLVFGPFKFGRPASGSGITLPYVYAVWLGVVALMYPLCKWYGRYKTGHREKKWLRYL